MRLLRGHPQFLLHVGGHEQNETAESRVGSQGRVSGHSHDATLGGERRTLGEGPGYAKAENTEHHKTSHPTIIAKKRSRRQAMRRFFMFLAVRARNLFILHRRWPGMEERGTISFWNDEKGFGFINPLHGGERVFLHIRSFTAHQGRPVAGEIVSYDVAKDDQGRPRAENVRFVVGHHRADNAPISTGGVIAISVALAFFGVLALLVLLKELPGGVFVYFAAAAFAGFVAFGDDKRRAETREWRISESTLIMISVLGGWPGSILGQQFFRHKYRKESFMASFWLSVLLNCGALAYVVVSF